MASAAAAAGPAAPKEEIKPTPEQMNSDVPVIVGKLEDLTVNQGQMIDFTLKVFGKKPLTVVWYRNESNKLKSTKKMKVTYAMSSNQTKLVVMEADGEDDGKYKLYVSNALGIATLSCNVTVILAEKVGGLVKQKPKEEKKEDDFDLKKFQRRTSVAEPRRQSIIDDSALKKRITAPSKPGRPEIVRADDEKVELQWTPPHNEGSSPILSFIIQKSTGDELWEEAATCPKEQTSAVITGLEDGKSYSFRILAVSEVGPGKESEPSEPIFREPKSKPMIIKDSFTQSNVVKQGQEFSVNVKYMGKPPPEPKWTYGDKELSAGDNVTIESAVVSKKEFSSKLVLRDVKRKDKGLYRITVTNQGGTDTADIELTVLGPPGRPNGPVKVLDVQRNSVQIGWKKPDDDGGQPILGYVIEKMNMKTGKWDAQTYKVGPSEFTFRVPDLVEDDEYQFRVRAENAEGLSEPLDTEKPVKVKNPFDVNNPPGRPELVDCAKNFIKIHWTKQKQINGLPLTPIVYNVQRRDANAERWSKINAQAVEVLEYRDEAVKANNEYVYRITAENDGLESIPGEPSKVLKAALLEEAPKIDLSNLDGKEVRGKAGDSLAVDVTVTGSPPPAITWSKEDKNLLPSDRIKSTHEVERAVLELKPAVRGDTGKYKIAAKNPFGEDSGEFSILVFDKPMPPTNLAITDIYADRCTLAWKAPADTGGVELSGYVIEKKHEQEEEWQTLTDAIKTETHVVRGLKAGKKYKFKVHAENIYGLSDPLENDKPILARDPYDRPDPPGKPEVTDSDVDHIAIKWAPPKKDGGAPITDYIVERKDAKGTRWAKVATEGVTEPEFCDRRVAAKKVYEYRVVAVNAGGESDPSQMSNPIKAKLLKDAPKVDLSSFRGGETRVRAGQPLNVEALISGSPDPTVAWKKDGTDVNESLRIQLSATEETALLTIPISERSDTGKYALTATNVHGQSTGELNVIVLDKPAAPENLNVADIRAEHCKVSWEPPKDDGGGEILGYIVEKCELGSSLWTKAPGAVNGTSHLVRDLEPLHKYHFRVKAENIYGVGEPVQTADAILAKNPFDPPSEPKDLVIDKYDCSSVSLKWKTPTSDGGNRIQGYQIDKMIANGRSDWLPVNPENLATGTTFTVQNLIEGSELEFRVVAVNDAGRGKPSASTGPHKVRDPISPAGPPGQPVVEGVTPSSVSLQWSKPTDTGNCRIQGYIVEVKPTGSEWSQANFDLIRDTAFTVPNLKKGQEYQFRVKAVNEAGPGAPSPPTGPVVAERPAEKPSIDMSRVKDIKVKAGQSFTISLPIRGWPVPTATWQCGDKNVVKDDRTQIETNEDNAFLIVKPAQRTDAGPYTVVLTNASGTSTATVGVLVLSVPSAPEGPLQPIKTTPTAITLQWKPPKDNGGSPLDYYVLEKKLSTSSQWQKASGNITPSDTQGTAKNLDEGQEYDFRVKAVNAEGQSEPLVTSEPVKAKYPFDAPDKPGKPECLGTSTDSITLSWEPPARDGGNPIRGYVIEKMEKSVNRWTRASQGEVRGTVFTVRNLTEGNPYEFRVAAVNDAGIGAFSDTSDTLKPMPPPSAPKVLLDSGACVTASVGEPFNFKIPFRGFPLPTVSWLKQNGTTKVGENGHMVFEVNDGEVLVTCQSAEKDDQGRYNVTLKNMKGSDTVQVNVIVLDKPSPPEGPLQVYRITPESCTLEWKPPKNDGGKPVSHYIVEMRNKKVGVWSTLTRFCRLQIYDVVGLSEGEQYEFQVSAVTDHGQGPPLITERPITAKYQFDTPGQPGSPTIEDVDEESVALSWTKPTKDGGDKIRGYVIEIREKGNDAWIPLNDVSPCKDTKFTAINLATNREFAFRVRAKNLAGLGEPSQPSAAVITKGKPRKASAPGQPSVVRVGKDSIDLTWTRPISDGGSPIKGYQVEKKRPRLSWELATFQNVIGENATITSLEDSKEYEFRVAAVTDAGVGDFSFSSLPVRVCARRAPCIPEFVKRPESVTVPCGREARFELIIDGEPKPEVKWFKNNVELRLGGKYRMYTNGDKLQMVIRNVEVEDAGEILCELTNSEGKETSAAKLRVQSPPELDSVMREQSVNEGDLLKVKIPFTGSGPLQFRLFKGVQEVPENGGRVRLAPFENYVILQIRDSKREDTGKYTVEISNESGTGVCDVPVRIKASPDQCNSLSVSNVTKSSCRLRWKAPDDDGGSRVTGYTIERQLVGKPYWTSLSSMSSETSYEVHGLVENKEYLFRVAALNAGGVGVWLETPTSIIAKMPFNVPEAPGEPKADEVGRDFVSLTWPKPRSDGGGRLLGYFIEKKEANSDNWVRVNEKPWLATIFNVSNLVENTEYDFRVVAVNEAGEGPAAVTGRRIKVQDVLKDRKPDAPPSFEFPLRDRFIQKGDSFKLIATVEGQPEPKCTWYKDGEVARTGSRGTIACIVGVCSLEIISADKTDGGTYTLKAVNALGSCETLCKVTIGDH